MKKRFLVVIFLSVLSTGSVQGEPFQNLGFELADTNRMFVIFPFEPVIGTGSTKDVIPFWQVNVGSVRLDTVGVNTWIAFDQEPVDLHTDDIFGPGSGFSVLAFGPDHNTGRKDSIFFIQSAEIPEDAIRLSYDFYRWSLGVLINGKSLFAAEIPFILNHNPTVPMTAHYDVSAYAGQTVELALFTQGDHTYFDNIRFSDVPFIIPEPSVFALGTFAGLIWFLARAGSIRRRPTIGSPIKTGA